MDARALQELIATRRVLIFDFDGTIADSSPLHARAFAAALRGYDVSFDYARIAGMRSADAVRTVLEESGYRVSAGEVMDLSAAKQRAVRASIADELEAAPGVREFLAWARDHHRLAICSSGSRETLTISLAKLGMADWFTPIVAAEDVERAKPSPDGYLLTLARSSCAPSEALAFEDSTAGLTAARLAGITVVDVTPPFRFAIPAAHS